MKKLIHALLFPSAFLASASCSPGTTSTLTKTALTVAVDVCKELPVQTEEEWVKLTCEAADGVATIVRMPKKQFKAAFTASVDAGGH